MSTRSAGHERVEREQAQRGRRVDDDEVELAAQRRDQPLQAPLAIGHGDQLDLRAREVARGGDEREPLSAVANT